MDIVFVLLPIALGMSFLGLMLFFWAVRSGQFDDLEGPRWRMLFDDPPEGAERRPPGGGEVP